MRCPFLKQTEAEYCGASGLRRLIVRPPKMTGERCISAAHRECPLYRYEGGDSGPRCPHLGMEPVQYCAAAPVVRFIPRSGSASRCENDGHQYCSLYQELGGAQETDTSLDGIPMRRSLNYSPNHMWLDLSPDGCSHIGIDAFFASALGTVDRVSVDHNSTGHPTALFEAGGFEFKAVFPNPMPVGEPNPHLHSHPACIVDDPYRTGWLAADISGASRFSTLCAGMLRGDDAEGWMREEIDRIERVKGGKISHGWLAHADRTEALKLYDKFFAPR